LPHTSAENGTTWLHETINPACDTCCRGCLWKWHRIEKGRALTDDEIGFVVELVMGWIEGQIH
jgi:hypothetical protein